MSDKIKSSLYFASLVLAIIAYYSVENSYTTQDVEIAQNTIENHEIDKAL